MFLQVAFFRNLFAFPEAKVKELLLHLLSDEQIEIRELASNTLRLANQEGKKKDKRSKARNKSRKAEKERKKIKIKNQLVVFGSPVFFFSLPPHRLLVVWLRLCFLVSLFIFSFSLLQMRSGLIQCGMTDPKLLKLFGKKVRQNALPKRKRSAAAKAAQADSEADPQAEKAQLLQRHVGILGIRAFVVASPYSLEAWMPDTLSLLAQVFFLDHKKL